MIIIQIVSKYKCWSSIYWDISALAESSKLCTVDIFLSLLFNHMSSILIDLYLLIIDISSILTLISLLAWREVSALVWGKKSCEEYDRLFKIIIKLSLAAWREVSALVWGWRLSGTHMSRCQTHNQAPGIFLLKFILFFSFYRFLIALMVLDKAS